MTEKPVGRGKFLSPPSLVGLAVGLVPVGLSFAPSLLPRPFVMQGVITGICVALGYGLGVFAAWAVRRLTKWEPAPHMRRVAWIVVLAANAGKALFPAVYAAWSRLPAGSPERLPIFQKGVTLRFAAAPKDFARPAGPWDEPRALYVQHGSDPVVWWSPDLFFHEPDRLKEPRAGRLAADHLVPGGDLPASHGGPVLRDDGAQRPRAQLRRHERRRVVGDHAAGRRRGRESSRPPLTSIRSNRAGLSDESRSGRRPHRD